MDSVEFLATTPSVDTAAMPAFVTVWVAVNRLAALSRGTLAESCPSARVPVRSEASRVARSAKDEAVLLLLDKRGLVRGRFPEQARLGASQGPLIGAESTQPAARSASTRCRTR